MFENYICKDKFDPISNYYNFPIITGFSNKFTQYFNVAIYSNTNEKKIFKYHRGSYIDLLKRKIYFLYTKIINTNPLERYKTAERMEISNAVIEKFIHQCFHENVKFSLLDLWKKLSSNLSKNQQIDFLAEKIKQGTCLAQTAWLLSLMPNFSTSSSSVLHQQLQENWNRILFIQLNDILKVEIKKIWLQAKNENWKRQEIEKSLDPNRLMDGIFYANPGMNASFNINKPSPMDCIRFWVQKIQTEISIENYKIKTFCIPMLGISKNPKIPHHLMFIQLTPKCRFYDMGFSKTGFYEFSNLEELLSALPAYLKLYYRGIYDEFHLPCILGSSDGSKPSTGVILEVPSKEFSDYVEKYLGRDSIPRDFL